MSVCEVQQTIWDQRVNAVPRGDETNFVRVPSDVDAAISVWLDRVVASWRDEDQSGTIDELEDGYVVRTPIPYEISRVGNSSLATFRAANIAISGHDSQDAYQSLIAEILDTFDALEAEPVLGPDATSQLRTLRQYIGRS